MLLGNHGDHRAPDVPTTNPRGVVLACVPGELHELPLVVLDAALRAAGTTATRLDATTPPAMLDEALARHPRPVLALHAMLPEPADPPSSTASPPARRRSPWDRVGTLTPFPPTWPASTR
jgi:hypothetical protein